MRVSNLALLDALPARSRLPAPAATSCAQPLPSPWRTKAARAAVSHMITNIFFQGWEPLLRTAIGTTATYLSLVVLLRFAGQRTLARRVAAR